MLTYVENTCQEEISNIALYRVNIERFEAALIFPEGIRTEGLTGRTVLEKANDFLSYLEVKSRYSETTVA